MQSRLSALALIASSLIWSAPARAEFKLVTVDVNRVLNESKEAIEKRKELQALSNKAKSKIEAKRKPLEDMEEKLRDSKVAENSKEAERFRAEAKSFARLVKDTEEEIKKEYLRANKDLTQDVLEEIRAFAKKNDIQMVLDKSEIGRGPVLFGAPSADITDDIIKSLNN